ncbi:MAG: gliding motility-associated C-terminal domain-containing protein [Bacteroidia bacterium]
MKRIICYFFLLTLTISPNFSQSKRYNIWHFGYNAGVNFNTNPPTTMDGLINTMEGVATICDAQGNLLIATDGRTVYDKTGSIMSNGMGLWGDASSTQSAIIFPSPANPNQYYIFTVDLQAGFFNGYGGVAWSLADLTLNGGNGEIISLNNGILTPSCEKLTAVRHPNGIDIWVIAHGWNSNAFYAWLVTASGVSANPVISNVGVNHPAYLPSGDIQTIGYLKASLDGKKLALALYDANVGATSYLQLFDFDRQTGIISNPLTRTLPIMNSASDGYYGLAFSPNNQYLYYALSSPLRVFQIDLTAPNPFATETVIYQNSGQSSGALQLAPDGKIYVNKFSSYYLDAIANPNAAGTACNYTPNAIHLTSPAAMGLPNFLDSYFIAPFSLGNDFVLCGDDTTLTAASGYDSYLWNTGDTTQSITITAAGTYYCQVSQYSEMAADTIVVSLYTGLTSFNMIPDQDTMPGCCEYNPLDAGEGWDSYLWSTNETTQEIVAQGAGTFWVAVQNECKTFVDTMLIMPYPLDISLPPDTFICPNQTVTISPTPATGWTSYSWYNSQMQLLSTQATYTANSVGMYILHAKNPCVTTQDNILIFDGNYPNGLNLENTYTHCENQAITLDAGIGWLSYAWANGGNGQTQTYSTNGNYSVITTNRCKTFTDEFSIEPKLETVSLGNNRIICNQESITLKPQPANWGGYVWQPSNSTNPTLSVSENGTYSVTVTGECGDVSAEVTLEFERLQSLETQRFDFCPLAGETIDLAVTSPWSAYSWSTGENTQTIQTTDAGKYTVILTSEKGCKTRQVFQVQENCVPNIFVPNAFTPNGDSENEEFKIVAYYLNEFHLIIFDRWGKKFFESQDIHQSWNGTFEGKDVPEGVYTFHLKTKDLYNQPFERAGMVTLFR